MKNLVRNLLQKVLGFKNYLFLFSLYSIRRMERGKYESEFMHFIKLNANEGVILDIGANIGITLAPLAKHFNCAQIHAFEPIAENFANLNKLVNYIKFPNTRLFNIALGNQSGNLRMIMPVLEHARMQGLSKAYPAGAEEEGVIYHVPLRRLDDLYPDATDIRAIKIDVENFEYEVLKGGVELLIRNRPMIYCELWDNENRTLVFDLLHSIGYEKYIFVEESNALNKVMENQEFSSNNFFFIHSN